MTINVYIEILYWTFLVLIIKRNWDDLKIGASEFKKELHNITSDKDFNKKMKLASMRCDGHRYIATINYLSLLLFGLALKGVAQLMVNPKVNHMGSFVIIEILMGVLLVMHFIGRYLQRKLAKEIIRTI